MDYSVTVLMAVHNGGPFLKPAIESILNQSYADFQFLVVDDASTDDTREVVRSYGDDRIELVCLKENVGQTAALNVGLRQTETPWMARMDADDYSAATRLEEQMKAVQEDPDIDCLGTYAWTFFDDPANVEGEITTHLDHSSIKRALLRGSPLIHGTIVVRTQALLDVGGYDDRYRYSADVEMYDRLLTKYKAGTIPSPLLGIRRHEGQGSRTSVAFDENIEIFSRRLEKHTYSPLEASAVKESLSRFYLFRARQRAGKARIVGSLRDTAKAARTSPKSFIINAGKVFLIDLIPERTRPRIKRILAKIRP